MPSVQIHESSLEELVSVPIDLIPQDQVLEHPVYVSISGRSVLLRPRGDVLTKQRATTLKEKIDTVSIPRSSLEALLSSAKKEISGENAQELKDIESSLGRLRILLVAQGHLLEGTREHQRQALQGIHELSCRLAVLLKKEPSLGRRFIHRFNEPSMYYVNHSVNVAIYSCLIGIKLNLPLESLKTLTYGAMIHNVGLIFLPRELLFKKGPLTREEWELMKSHPILGARHLQTFRVPHEVIQIVLQHHERMDGQGYPNASPGSENHLLSRICSIADVYAALTSDRPYRAALQPGQAIVLMKSMKGKFDPMILNMID